MTNIGIPMDIYESPREIVIIVPLGGVDKKSVELFFDDFQLMLKWARLKPHLKEDLIIQQDECYWWEFVQTIQLPPYVYFDRIHSEITADNILIITVPKSLHPGTKMKLDVTIHKTTLAGTTKHAWSVTKTNKSQMMQETSPHTKPWRWRPRKTV